MTKDEILQINGCELLVNDCAYVELDRVRKAMDEYAEQVAADFAQCIGVAGHEQLGENKWTNISDGFLTTKELYRIYLKHKNEKK